MKLTTALPAILFCLFCNRSQAQNCQPDPNKRFEEHSAESPNNFICHIVVTRNTGTFNATASFISKNVLVGAGHSFREKLFSKIRTLTIFVGRRNENGQNTFLFSKTYTRSELTINIHRKFQHGSSPDFDYALVALPENVSQEFFQLNTFAATKSVTDSVFVTGYPADKGNRALWKKGDSPQAVTETTNVLLYPMFTFVADSGAPVWCKLSGSPALVAIHGTGHYHNGPCNAGVKLTAERIQEFNSFITANSR